MSHFLCDGFADWGQWYPCFVLLGGFMTVRFLAGLTNTQSITIETPKYGTSTSALLAFNGAAALIGVGDFLPLLLCCSPCGGCHRNN